MTIHTVRDGSRAVHTIQDGRDYRELLELARSGKIASTNEGGTPANCSRIVEHEGRKYLVKKGTQEFCKFDARLKYRIFGSPFLFVMKKVERAIADGCDRVQRIFLVDETVERNAKTKAILVTAWMVIEYLPGETLAGCGDDRELIRKIPEAMRELHKYKLTHRDCNLSNFIVSGGRVRIIDIHFFSDLFFGQAFRTICKLKDRYDLDVPVDGILNNILFTFAKAWYFLRKGRRK